MPSLKEVRKRIESVRSTQQITSAMKMVAASKLRRAQLAILKLRPYAAKMNEILHNLSGSVDDASENVYSAQREVKNVLIITVSSNRGLCGAFNTNIIKHTIKHIDAKYAEQFKNGNLDLLCAGKKVSDYFIKNNYNVIERLDHLFNEMTFENVVPVANKLIDFFIRKRYDRIEIIYNQFKNAAIQIITVEDFLPVRLVENDQKESGKNNVNYQMIFLPNSFKMSFLRMKNMDLKHSLMNFTSNG